MLTLGFGTPSLLCAGPYLCHFVLCPIRIDATDKVEADPGGGSSGSGPTPPPPPPPFWGTPKHHKEGGKCHAHECESAAF